MDNLTNQVIVLKSGRKFYIIRQALYKGTTYYLGADTLKADDENDEEMANCFAFLEKVEQDGKTFIKEVTDPTIIQVLAKNIKID